jgi:large subunit ribosomal protein L4
MPRKMRRLALRSALSAKAAENQIVLLDDLVLEAPRTREFLSILDNLKVESSALVLLPGRDVNVEQSARNIPDVKALQATCLNVFDLLKFDTLILPVKSLEVIERILG